MSTVCFLQLIFRAKLMTLQRTGYRLLATSGNYISAGHLSSMKVLKKGKNMKWRNYLLPSQNAKPVNIVKQQHLLIYSRGPVTYLPA